MLLYYLIAYLRSFVCQFDGCCCVFLALYFPSIVENGRKSQCPAGLFHFHLFERRIADFWVRSTYFWQLNEFINLRKLT